MKIQLPSNHDAAGYIALVTVLVVMTVTTLIATSLLVFGTSWLATSSTIEDAARARNAADSCTEVALAKIAADGNFTGSDAQSLSAVPQVSCTYIVTGAAPTKTISASGISSTATKKVTTTTSQLTPSVVISSSQIVP